MAKDVCKINNTLSVQKTLSPGSITAGKAEGSVKPLLTDTTNCEHLLQADT